MKVDRLGLTGIAGAVAVVTFLVGSALVAAKDNGDTTERIDTRLQTAPPATQDQVAELGKQVGNLPSSLPTPRVVVTAVPGPPGPAGAAGRDGGRGPTGPAGRVVVTTSPTSSRGTPAQARPSRPAPRVTVTATPQPREPGCVVLGVPFPGSVCSGRSETE